jgi:hypothetical protein
MWLNGSEEEGHYADYLSNETLLACDLADVFLNPHLHPITAVSIIKKKKKKKIIYQSCNCAAIESVPHLG